MLINKTDNKEEKKRALNIYNNESTKTSRAGDRDPSFYFSWSDNNMENRFEYLFFLY